MDISKLTIENEDNSNKKIINHTYRILQKIGQGQYGKVMLAETIKNDKNNNDNNIVRPDRPPSQLPPLLPNSSSSLSLNKVNSSNKNNKQSTTNYVAIKTINRIDKTRLITKTYLSHTTKIKREIQIMKECKHPNVVQLYQVIDDLKYDKILLVLEYCQYGEIDWKNYNHYNEKYLKKKNGGLPLNRLLRDVVNGLEYLHDYKHIIHRDLKPSNLLISKDKSIKISDFGVSLILENNSNDEKELGKTMGTPAFFAPELCQFVNNRFSMLDEFDKTKSKIDNKIDIWSLGVILYCLVFHNLPFSGNNEFSLFKNIVNNKLKFPQIKKSSNTTMEDINELKLLKDLINKLLTKDPTQRISLKDIKQHAFTTYDLKNSKEISDFMDFNKKLINSQTKPKPNVGLTEKLRKFFTGKTEPTNTISPSNSKKNLDQEKRENELLNYKNSFSKLEPVDDLLDSYFDDSSSMGSLENEEQGVDTTNILDSIVKPSSNDNEISNDNNLQTTTFQNPIIPHRQLREKPSNENFSINKFLTQLSTSINESKWKVDTDQKSQITQSSYNQDNNNINSKETIFNNPGNKTNEHALSQNSSHQSISRIGAPSPLKFKDSFYNNSGNSNVSNNSLNKSTALPNSSSRNNISGSTSTLTSSAAVSATTTPISTQFYSPIMTPNTTNDEVITIGAGSPSSMKSMFSPSKRFFARKNSSKKQNKNQKLHEEIKPTISSLSSPNKKFDPKNEKRKFTNLMEPPPIFGGLSSAFIPVSNNNNGTNNNNGNNEKKNNTNFNNSPGNSPKGNGNGNGNGNDSRDHNDPFLSPSAMNNSPSNQSYTSSKRSLYSPSQKSGSGTGYGLMRITSSSSSLNLNAYLTDDSLSIRSTNGLDGNRQYNNNNRSLNLSLSLNLIISDQENDGEEDDNSFHFTGYKNGRSPKIKTPVQYQQKFEGNGNDIKEEEEEDDIADDTLIVDEQNNEGDKEREEINELSNEGHIGTSNLKYSSMIEYLDRLD